MEEGLEQLLWPPKMRGIAKQYRQPQFRKKQRQQELEFGVGKRETTTNEDNAEEV